MEVTAYYVKGCKLDYKNIFTGYVLNLNDEPIIDSIKRKTGYKELLCEVSNEGFDYDKVNVYSVPLTELSVGDLMIITGRYNPILT